MSALGTLSTKRLRPRYAFAIASPFARTGAMQPQQHLVRKNITGETAFTVQWAHFPVRLNGRECAFYSGPNVNMGYPWTVAQQAVIDADGLIFWHAHRYSLLWAVSPGVHTIDVHVKHQAGAGAKPKLVINANPAIGVAAQTIDSTASDDTDDTLHASITSTISGTLFCELVSTNVAENKKTTWGVIETT